ncbi:MAG: sensor histidine kinase [Candidatus Methanospirareceae archaeon]
MFGTYVVGHKRIKDRDIESEIVLKKTLSKHKVNDELYNILIKLLKKVDIVDEDFFDANFFDRLSFISQIAIREHQHAIVFKKEAVHLAHVFLLPIQSIIADAENLFNETEEGSELKEIAENILQEITILYFIAENIRGSVLENSDRFGYEFHYVEIRPIIQDVINLFQKQAEKKKVAINDLFVKKDIPVTAIQISEPHIKQVFFNLIHNAVKYSYTSTEKSERYISVICNSYKNFYRVEISNFGVGITPEEISDDLIFKDGYRGIFARDCSRTGSGFGLGRVREIIKAHNGDIKVESRQVGIGPKIDPYKTTVTVCIPFYQPRRSPHGNKNDIMDRR